VEALCSRQLANCSDEQRLAAASAQVAHDRATELDSVLAAPYAAVHADGLFGGTLAEKVE